MDKQQQIADWMATRPVIRLDTKDGIVELKGDDRLPFFEAAANDLELQANTPAPVPQVVERLAFREALLLEFGIKFSDVQQILESIEDSTERELALIKFEEAKSVQRNDTLVELLRVRLTKTHEQTDNLYRAAAQRLV